MNNETLPATGPIGSDIAASRCSTPLLVILFGVVGHSARVGWLDYVLLSALVVLLAVTIDASYGRACAIAGTACVAGADKSVAKEPV